MSIQVLKLTDKGMWFTNPKVTALTIRDLFSSPMSYLKDIPETERINLFYTVHECDPDASRPRQFKRTNTLVFDIDNILTGREADYIQVTSLMLMIPQGEQIAWVASGNGLHAIICLDAYEDDTNYFRIHREQYRAICDKLAEALAEQRLCYTDDQTGLTIGKPDPSVFDSARVLRMPGTINKKPGRPDTECRLISGSMSPIAWDWERVSGISNMPGDKLNAHDRVSVSREFEEVFGVPDTDAVLNGCSFLVHAKKDQAVLPEPEWYQMVNIVSRLENGQALVHEFSKGHAKYSATETNKKIIQAKTKTGPFLCTTINQTWGKCHECPNYNKYKTPIQIVSSDFIKTASTGFHKRMVKADGNLGAWKPVYEDLRRQFEREKRYKTFSNSKAVFVYGPEPKWSELDEAWIENYAQIKFVLDNEHLANNNMVSEFKGVVRRTNIVPPDWFIKNSERKFNFQNCVYDLATDATTDHRHEYGMTYVLPYEYDSQATAPKFEKFLLDMTCNRPELAETMIEYMSYCLSGEPCWAHKALMLYGSGRNGKSLFFRILQSLVTRDAYSAMMMNDLEKDTNRYQLNNKLFNIGEETPTKALTESAMFKNLVAGGLFEMRPLYGKPITVQNKTKFIFASNILPQIYNIGMSITERLLIIPCQAEFTQSIGNQNPFLYEEILPERPGIMNMVIKAHHALRARGEFMRLKVLDETMEALKIENDNIYIFYKEFLEVTDSDKGHEMADVFQKFCTWCENNENKKLSSKIFWRELRKYIKDLDQRKYRPHGQKERLRGVNIINGQELL